MKFTKLNKWVLVPAVAGVLAIGGIAFADNRDELPAFIPLSQATPANATFITEEQAKEIANAKVKGDIVEFSLDSDERRVHFDVEMKDETYEYEFDIDAVTGDVYDYDRERDDDQVSASETQPKTAVASVRQEATPPTSSVNGNAKLITQDEAIAIALEAAPGTVTSFESDDDEYEIEIRNGKTEYDIEIHVYTGEITKFEQELDDDNDDD